MTYNMWYPKEKPLQGITGWGGGATGLRMSSAGSPYTDALWFDGAASNATAMAIKTLELYNTSLTETAWEVPAGVTNISVAVMGGGGGGYNLPSPSSTGSFATGGGELGWRNNITVTPGQVLYVKAGATSKLGAKGPNTDRDGMTSDAGKYLNSDRSESAYTDSAVTDYSRAGYIRTWSGGSNKWLVFADGGQSYDDSGGGEYGYSRMTANPFGTAGTANVDYNAAGQGGYGRQSAGGSYNSDPKGAGGAGGYTGKGGNGSNSYTGDGVQAGSGGGGGGGGFSSTSNNFTRGRGGSTYMWGEGTSGAAGAQNGSGGDGSASGGNTNSPPAGMGQGGDAYRDGWVHVNAKPPLFNGWARIVYSKDGTTRTFPSTNVGYPG